MSGLTAYFVRRQVGLSACSSFDLLFIGFARGGQGAAR